MLYHSTLLLISGANKNCVTVHTRTYIKSLPKYLFVLTKLFNLEHLIPVRNYSPDLSLRLQDESQVVCRAQGSLCHTVGKKCYFFYTKYKRFQIGKSIFLQGIPRHIQVTSIKLLHVHNNYYEEKKIEPKVIQSNRNKVFKLNLL